MARDDLAASSSPLSKVPPGWGPALCLGLACTLFAGSPPAPICSGEASGIARAGDYLLIADDEEMGAYYRMPLNGAVGPELPVDLNRLERVELPGANSITDLESIAVSAAGRVLVLSERSRSLYDSDGWVAEYAHGLTEFGNRGLEGLALRPGVEGGDFVAALWEGGYPVTDRLPEFMREQWKARALAPIVQVHFLEEDQRRIRIARAGQITLEVPEPPNSPQRFRAPDLVWHRLPNGSWGFIVLLSSQHPDGNPGNPSHWLQCFTLGGNRFGPHLDLNGFLPEKLQGLNWEGLDWFVPGESLVLVHEKALGSDVSAFVLELPIRWKSGVESPAPPQARPPAAR